MSRLSDPSLYEFQRSLHKKQVSKRKSTYHHSESIRKTSSTRTRVSTRNNDMEEKHNLQNITAFFSIGILQPTEHYILVDISPLTKISSTWIIFWLTIPKIIKFCYLFLNQIINISYGVICYFFLMGTRTQTSNLVFATTSIFQLLYRLLVKFCYVCNLNIYGYFIKHEEKGTRRHSFLLGNHRRIRETEERESRQWQRKWNLVRANKNEVTSWRLERPIMHTNHNH